MARIVYGLFDSEADASPAVRELTRNCNEHRAFAVQTHRTNPLDADHLPESATEVGRNIITALVAGAVLGGVLGGIAGAVTTVPGFSPGFTTLFGTLAGLCVALLSAVMSGNRVPKQPLRELAAQLGNGAVMLVIAADNSREAEVVTEVLEDHGADSVSEC